MASYTVARAKHATLTAATVETITFSVDVVSVEVVNRDGTAEIYFTIDGTTPVAGADDTEVVPAAVGAAQKLGSPGSRWVTDTVKLISTGTPKYSVVGYRGDE